MGKIIELRNREGSLVTELNYERNIGIYLMLERGTLPEVIIWGDRFFQRDYTADKFLYSEVFAMVVF